MTCTGGGCHHRILAAEQIPAHYCHPHPAPSLPVSGSAPGGPAGVAHEAHFSLSLTSESSPGPPSHPSPQLLCGGEGACWGAARGERARAPLARKGKQCLSGLSEMCLDWTQSVPSWDSPAHHSPWSLRAWSPPLCPMDSRASEGLRRGQGLPRGLSV